MTETTSYDGILVKSFSVNNEVCAEIYFYEGTYRVVIKSKVVWKRFTLEDAEEDVRLWIQSQKSYV